MRVRGRQAPSHSHTWLPYITPNGVRLAQNYDLFLRKLFFEHNYTAYTFSWLIFLYMTLIVADLRGTFTDEVSIGLAQ